MKHTPALCAAALAAALFAAAPACAQQRETFSGTVDRIFFEDGIWMSVKNGAETREFFCGGNTTLCNFDNPERQIGRKVRVTYVFVPDSKDEEELFGNHYEIRRLEYLAQTPKASASGQKNDAALAQARAAAASPSAKNAAQINSLGVWHERGLHGLPKNAEKAFEYYQLAAAHGNALAMHNLGDLYRQGKGVPHNGAAAFEWYQKAAQAGHAIGLEDMGDCYLDGIGVAQNRDEAVRLYRQAAKRGRKSATQKLHRLGE